MEQVNTLNDERVMVLERNIKVLKACIEYHEGTIKTLKKWNETKDKVIVSLYERIDELTSNPAYAPKSDTE
jgi:hypothetical protein